jgi:superfamily I DNA/RNA helicase/RecB family exonuclease
MTHSELLEAPECHIVAETALGGHGASCGGRHRPGGCIFGVSAAARLVRVAPGRRAAPGRDGDGLRWDGAARRVLDSRGGFLRLLGGPGTGKTALLVETVARRIAERGADPEQVLVLTASRRAAQRLREQITERLAALTPAQSRLPRTVREPVVRTVHSYAFAVLRLQAMLHGEPPPRLLSGPEQDAVVRELLAGELADDGGARWPARLRPALGLPGFAAELRDLLLRAAERGLGPEGLILLGRQHDRPEWVAAGQFFQTYEQVTMLRGSVGSVAPQASAPALDAAELVAAALLAFDTDPDVLGREQARVRHLFVDDAQHLDPQQAELAGRLGAAATEFVVAGDPDQAVFAFRGADPGLLREADPGGERTVVLTACHRMAPAVHEAVARLVARLPGKATHRLSTSTVDGRGEVQVRLLRSAAAEASWVADRLRRAHLLDGVPWSQMAVLVRSTVRSLPVLRRALLAAGVPLAVPREELPLARQPAVWPFLALLLAAVEPGRLDEDTAVALLGSPLAGADPLALRRLRRGLRRLAVAAGSEQSSGELLVAALRSADPVPGLEERAGAPLRRLVELIGIARAHAARGVEEVLWQVWRASGLQHRWSAAVARGGSTGAQADRDLDAVVALFDAAARYTDRLPGAGVAGFADYLRAQQIPGDSLAPKAPVGDAVEILTAHAAVGREWTVVAVPGVQEGSWPDLRLRGTLLGVERLVDVLSGVCADTASQTAPLLAEERRLLVVAASRARCTLLVSAVSGEEEQPSRFLDELDGLGVVDVAAPRPVIRPPRALVLAELVGELRRAVCDPSMPALRRQNAARQLARLAEAAVPGAHPDDWAGVPSVSADLPLRPSGDPVTVSPSTVELVQHCPLRWLLERHGGQDSATLPSVTGMLVHALVQLAATGAGSAELDAALRQAWTVLDAGAPWFSRREHQRVRDMLTSFRRWLAATRADLHQVAVEHDLDVLLPSLEPAPSPEPASSPDGPPAPADPPAPAGPPAADSPAESPPVPPIRIRGRVDRLERDRHGRPVIVDVKTGRGVTSKDAAATHPQLAVYQLAAALGAFAALGVQPEPGGARLLFVSKSDARSGCATERVQPPLDVDAQQQWLAAIRAAAEATNGPSFTARENPDCDRCPVRTACPLSEAGRQVTI